MSTPLKIQLDYLKHPWVVLGLWVEAISTMKLSPENIYAIKNLYTEWRPLEVVLGVDGEAF